MRRFVRRLLVGCAAAVAVTGGVVAAVPGAAGAGTSATDISTAGPTAAGPSVGALFFPSVLGLLPLLHAPHFCSASVLDSSTRNLVITAAHCVYGPGLTIEFAPGFHDNVTPYGVWDVRRIYIDPQWRSGEDPQHDVAILQLAPRGGRQIEDVTGGHPLGVPAVGANATVLGYPAGSGGGPISCTNTIYDTDGYPSFDCHGYADGTSGGPWLVGPYVAGVIGGLQQGGCTGTTSFSSPFGPDTTELLARAEAGGAGDDAPLAFTANTC